MSINFIDTIKPANSNFPIVEDIDIQGGYMSVSNSTERNSIPASKKKIGMMVCESSTYDRYVWNGMQWIKQNHSKSGDLLADDHTQYVHNSVSRTVSAVHVFSNGINISNNKPISGRNSSNTLDVQMLKVNTSNEVVVGSGQTRLKVTDTESVFSYDTSNGFVTIKSHPSYNGYGVIWCGPTTTNNNYTISSNNNVSVLNGGTQLSFRVNDNEKINVDTNGIVLIKNTSLTNVGTPTGGTVLYSESNNIKFKMPSGASVRTATHQYAASSPPSIGAQTGPSYGCGLNFSLRFEDQNGMYVEVCIPHLMRYIYDNDTNNQFSSIFTTNININTIQY